MADNFIQSRPVGPGPDAGLGVQWQEYRPRVYTNGSVMDAINMSALNKDMDGLQNRQRFYMGPTTVYAPPPTAKDAVNTDRLNVDMERLRGNKYPYLKQFDPNAIFDADDRYLKYGVTRGDVLQLQKMADEQMRPILDPMSVYRQRIPLLPMNDPIMRNPPGPGPEGGLRVEPVKR